MKFSLVFVQLALYLCNPVSGIAAEPMFVHLAEGFTSKNDQTGIDAAQRMFSAPMFAELCPFLQAPARLRVLAPKPLQLRRNHWFKYTNLVVMALDASGKVLPPTPIEVGVEETVPPVLNLRSDMTAGTDGKVLPIHKGRFRFRFRTICNGHSAAAVVKAEVVDP